MELPRKIPLQRFCDDRGDFTNIPLTDSGIKRTYIINNSQKGVVRAFHGHKNESKIFYVTRGSFKFNFINMKTKKDPITFTLNESVPEIIICPKGWYNGFVSLKDESTLTVFSSSTMEDSKIDYYPEKFDRWGKNIWHIQNR